MKTTSRRSGVAAFTAAVILFLLLIGFYADHGLVESNPVYLSRRNGPTTVPPTHRKLLHDGADKVSGNGTEGGVEPNRIWGDKCSKSDISISQGPTAPMPSGIPTYTVEIVNVCVSGCHISHIHLACGWFSSARLVNPSVFKRLGFNDCLVNDGKPLANGRALSFQYANTAPYSLSVSSLKC